MSNDYWNFCSLRDRLNNQRAHQQGASAQPWSDAFSKGQWRVIGLYSRPCAAAVVARRPWGCVGLSCGTMHTIVASCNVRVRWSTWNIRAQQLYYSRHNQACTCSTTYTCACTVHVVRTDCLMIDRSPLFVRPSARPSAAARDDRPGTSEHNNYTTADSTVHNHACTCM